MPKGSMRVHFRPHTVEINTGWNKKINCHTAEWLKSFSFSNLKNEDIRYLGSILPHCGGKAHLQLFSSARSNLWSLYHFPELFIKYSASWRNKVIRLSFWTLGSSQLVHCSFLPFLLYYFPKHLVQKPSRCRQRQLCLWSASWPKP